MSKTIKVLFLGDLVGRPGRNSVEKFLCEKVSGEAACDSKNDSVSGDILRRDTFDFIIANVENASHGFGLTKKNHDELMSYGIDCMTSGNHIWDKKDIYTYIDESNVLIRPFNYHKTARGVGYRVFNNNIIVLNLLGKTFMQPVVCPFQALYDAMNNFKKDFDLDKTIIIVDFHAEATAEKICFAHFAKSLGVSAVFGTHTHVQTADEKIIFETCKIDNDFECFNKEELATLKAKDGMAYITDAGFCGSYSGVIGMEYESSLKRLVTSIPERFDVSVSERCQINAVCVEFSKENGAALNIKRINFDYKKEGSA